jgi:hypothetical protein
MVMGFSGLCYRHCEEQSDEAIHSSACGAMDCFASLAMTFEINITRLIDVNASAIIEL